MRALTPEEIAEIKLEMVQKGRPVRFQDGGQTISITTGEKQPKGINVIHQIHYWNFTEETSKKIAALTGTKPVFSD